VNEASEQSRPLSVLVVISSPVLTHDGEHPSWPRLDVWKEWQNLADAVQGHPVTLRRLSPPTRFALERALRTLPPDVVHFIGHGSAEAIQLEDDVGRADLVPVADFVACFPGQKPSLVVLNACKSDKAAQALVDSGVKAVVGTAETLHDHMAKVFAQGFYLRVADGEPVGASLDRTKNDLEREAQQHSGGDAVKYLKAVKHGVDLFRIIGESALNFPRAAGESECIPETVRAPDLPYHIGFVGRGKELVELAGHLAEAGKRAVVITGIGGCGKTYLAVEAARRSAWRFAGGVAYLSARDRDDLTIGDVAAAVAHAAAPGAALPDDPEGQAAFIAQCLIDRRVLLVIDNAENFPQQEQARLANCVSAFDPRNGSKVVITCRPRVACFQGIDAAVVYAVPPLDEATARELIESEAERSGLWQAIEPHSARFRRVTRYHAQLIHMGVGMVATDGIVPALDNLEGLKGQDVEEMVRGCTLKMISDLPERAQHYLKRLGVFAGEAGLDALEAVLGGGPTRDSLPDLTRAGLVDAVAGQSRYALHPLTVDVLRTHSPLESDEAAALEAVHAEYFIGLAAESEDPWPEVDREFANVSTAAEWASRRLERAVGRSLEEMVEGFDRLRKPRTVTKQAWAPALGAAHALRTYIRRRAEPRGLRWLQGGVVAARFARNRNNVAVLCDDVGLAHKARADYDKALVWHRRSIEILEQSGDQAGLAAVCSNIGGVYYARDDQKQALKWLLKSAEIIQQTGDRAGLAPTYNNIAAVYHARGEHREALEWYRRSLSITEQMDDPAGLAAVCGNMGMAHSACGDHDEALEWHRKSAEIRREIGDRPGLARTCNSIGMVHKSRGDLDAALEWLRRGLETMEQIGDRAGLATAYSDIGSIHYTRGEHEQALKWCRKSAEIFDDTGDRGGLATTWHNMAKTYQAMARLGEALDHARRSRDLWAEIGLEKRVADEEELIAEIERAMAGGA